MNSRKHTKHPYHDKCDICGKRLHVASLRRAAWRCDAKKDFKWVIIVILTLTITYLVLFNAYKWAVNHRMNYAKCAYNVCKKWWPCVEDEERCFSDDGCNVTTFIALHIIGVKWRHWVLLDKRMRDQIRSCFYPAAISERNSTSCSMSDRAARKPLSTSKKSSVFACSDAVLSSLLVSVSAS